ALDGLGRGRLRQCPVQELLCHPRMRTARATPLCLTGRGPHGLLQLHRRLLQSHPAALRSGVSLAHLLRTGDANRPTVRHPLNRPPNRGNFTVPPSSRPAAAASSASCPRAAPSKPGPPASPPARRPACARTPTGSAWAAAPPPAHP